MNDEDPVIIYPSDGAVYTTDENDESNVDSTLSIRINGTDQDAGNTLTAAIDSVVPASGAGKFQLNQSPGATSTADLTLTVPSGQRFDYETVTSYALVVR